MEEIKNTKMINVLNTLTIERPMILPTNLLEQDSKYSIFENSTASIKKLLNENDLNIDIFENDKETVYKDNRSIDWVIPTILITSTMITQNPLLVSMLTNIISSYVYEIFKGKSKNPTVKTKIIYKDEKKKKYFDCDYEGDNSGLCEINKMLETLND